MVPYKEQMTPSPIILRDQGTISTLVTRTWVPSLQAGPLIFQVASSTRSFPIPFTMGCGSG